MGWIVAIVTLSVVMAVMTVAELRRPVSGSTVQLPELTWADRVITVFMLGHVHACNRQRANSGRSPSAAIAEFQLLERGSGTTAMVKWSRPLWGGTGDRAQGSGPGARSRDNESTGRIARQLG